MAACAPMTSDEPALAHDSDNKSLQNNARDLLDRARAARTGGENEASARLYRSAITTTPGPDQAAIRIEFGELLLQMRQTPTPSRWSTMGSTRPSTTPPGSAVTS